MYISHPNHPHLIHCSSALSKVLQETLRLYPPATGTTKAASTEITLSGYRIPKDTQISVSIPPLQCTAPPPCHPTHTTPTAPPPSHPTPYCPAPMPSHPHPLLPRPHAIPPPTGLPPSIPSPPPTPPPHAIPPPTAPPPMPSHPHATCICMFELSELMVPVYK